MNGLVKPVAVVAVLILTLAACGGQPNATPSSGASSTDGNNTEIVVVLPTEPTSLDKAVEETFNSANITGNIFDRLVQYDASMQPAPMLATSWEAVDDTTWRFELRDDVTFHNGEPFNAESVKYTLERANTEGSVLAYYLTNVSAVNAVSEFVVEIETTQPDPILPNRVGAWIDMVPQGAGEDDNFGTNPIGSGPYTFAGWVPGESIVLEANDDYWGDAVDFQRVTFRFVPEVSTRQTMLLNGEADIIPNVPADLKGVIDDSDVAHIASSPGLRKMLVIIDPVVEPLGDVRVRQALNYAVDKDLIIETVLGGDAQKSTGIIHRAIPGYNDEMTDYYNYDPDRARSLLEEAGVGNGFDVTFYHTVGVFPKDKEIAEAVADQLGDIGVNVTLQPLEFNEFWDGRVNAGTLEGLALMRYGNAKADPSEIYTWALWSGGVTVYVTDPAMDELIVETEQLMDADQRLELFRQMEETTVTEIVPLIFLFDLENVFGVSNKISWQPTPWEPVDLRLVKAG